MSGPAHACGRTCSGTHARPHFVVCTSHLEHAQVAAGGLVLLRAGHLHKPAVSEPRAVADQSTACRTDSPRTLSPGSAAVCWMSSAAWTLHWRSQAADTRHSACLLHGRHGCSAFWCLTAQCHESWAVSGCLGAGNGGHSISGVPGVLAAVSVFVSVELKASGRKESHQSRPSTLAGYALLACSVPLRAQRAAARAKKDLRAVA